MKMGSVIFMVGEEDFMNHDACCNWKEAESSLLSGYFLAPCFTSKGRGIKKCEVFLVRRSNLE
jgi:hypothetical protein